MQIDPTYKAYLDEAIASRPIRLNKVDVQERRDQMKRIRTNLQSWIPPFVTVEWREISTPGRSLRLRITRPIGCPGGPAILYCHGGGWMYGSPDQSSELASIYAAHVGAVVVSPEYRLSPEHPFPAAFDDCFAALKWVLCGGHAAGIDPTRVAVAGESSGANLAAACALEARSLKSPPLRLQVLNYPALDTNFRTDSYQENADAPILNREEMIYFWDAYLAGHMRLRDHRARPLIADSLSSLPPAHIIVAEYDPLRDDGWEYARRLRASGVPVTLVNATGLTHGFFRAVNRSDTVRRYAYAICSALKSSLQYEK